MSLIGCVVTVALFVYFWWSALRMDVTQDGAVLGVPWPLAPVIPRDTTVVMGQIILFDERKLELSMCILLSIADHLLSKKGLR